MRNVWLFLLIAGLSMSTVLADMDLVAMDDISRLAHLPRTDAVFLLNYDVFDNQNSIIMYGGKGYNPDSGTIEFMDPRGDIWKAVLYYSNNSDYENNIDFQPLSTDHFRLSPQVPGDPYPPAMRFGHCGVLIPLEDIRVLHNDDTTSTVKKYTYTNLVILGGKRQDDPDNRAVANNTIVTSEVWVNAEYEIVIPDEEGLEKPQKRHHWYEVTPTGMTPPARYDAQVVPLFSEETPFSQRNTFLYFGGKDENGNLLNDAYIGTLTRSTTPAPGTSNEWAFEIAIDIEFTAVTPDTHFKTAGAEVHYDPYYGMDGGERTPRVIIIGGERDGAPASGEVVCIYPGNDGWETPIIRDELPDLPDARKHMASVFNPREHRLRVFGGVDGSGSQVMGVLDLDLKTPGQWVWEDPAYTGSHQHAVYSLGTRLYQVTGSGSGAEWTVLWDRSEATSLYDRPDEAFVWDIRMDDPWGLDTPVTVFNSPRLHPFDTVRIHQTRDAVGKVNDCFAGNNSIPSWCPNVVIEGVVKNGVKPILYNLFDTSGLDGALWIDPYDGSVRFDRSMPAVLHVNTVSTIRNIKFCHFETYQQPDTGLPAEIPVSRLEHYMDEDDPGIDWDLAYHHVDDPGIFVHAAFQLENCDFEFNGVGIVLICVTSAIVPADIHHCMFRKNQIGLLSLETEHVIRYNTFRDNYLTGIVFDKGARTVFSENLLMNNGRLTEMGITGFDTFESAALSCFASPWDVPGIQTPFIFNNTFVDNRYALSVTEPGDRAQYMNRPVMFNNIVSDTGSNPPVFLKSSQRRCDIICMHNCFDLNPGVTILDIDDLGIPGYLTWRNMEDDPVFANDRYQLIYGSPCVDRGLHILNPGVTSRMRYCDYGEMDIGYHYLPETGNIPNSPDDLEITEKTMTWTRPLPRPDGYLVTVEDAYGGILEQVFVSDSETPELSFSHREEDHLWFGVMSHYNKTAFSSPVWIEWIQ